MNSIQTISGNKPDRDLIKRVKQFNVSSAKQAVSNMISGHVWQIFEIPQGISGMGYSEHYVIEDIKEVIWGLPSNHPIAEELVHQVNDILSEIPSLSPDNPRLHYHDSYTNPIDHAFFAAGCSLSHLLFNSAFVSSVFLLEHPVLTEDNPPDTENIMAESVNCMLNYQLTQPEKIREYVTKLEETKLFPGHLAYMLAGFGDTKSIDFLIDFYVQNEGVRDFIWGGVQTVIPYNFLAKRIKEDLDSHGIPKEVYLDKLDKVTDSHMKSQLYTYFLE